MKRLLIKLSLFIIPIFIFLVIYEFFLESLPNTYEIKKKIIETKRDSVQQIVLGTSHSFSGINPQKFDLYTINLANNSQSLYYDIKILDKYLNDFKKLNTVIFEISFFSLWYNFDQGPDAWRSLYYYKYWDIQPYSLKINPLNRLLLTHYPLNKLKALIKSSQTCQVYYTTNGWAVNDLPPGHFSSKNAERRYKQLLNYYMNESYLAQNINTLSKVFEALEDRGINIVLVQLPISSLLNTYIEQKWIVRNNEAINSLKNKYPILYLDYSKDRRFDDSLFVDTDHLSFIGANIFTSILNTDIKKLKKNNTSFDQ